MPTPDKLKLSMLKPPADFASEKYTEKIFGYLTPSQMRLFKRKLDAEDIKMSEGVRKGIKLYCDGKHSHQVDPGDMERFMREIMALVTHQPLPITKPRNLDEEAKWSEARNQAKARMDIQKPLHADFQREVIPLLKEALEKDNYGLEHTEIKEKEVLTKRELKEQALELRDSYQEFLREKEKTQQEFADCKWKVKEVKV